MISGLMYEQASIFKKWDQMYVKGWGSPAGLQNQIHSKLKKSCVLKACSLLQLNAPVGAWAW